MVTYWNPPSKHFPSTPASAFSFFSTATCTLSSIAIYNPQFLYFYSQVDEEVTEDSLNIENTVWASTVVASGVVLGLVVYTGVETRSVMNTSQPSVKVGGVDLMRCSSLLW